MRFPEFQKLKQEPLVSVIMPAYNAAEYIGMAIESVLNQTYRNIELLICDDCSTDDTMAVIRSYDDPRVTLYQNKENQGYLKTCNILFSKVNGDLVTFQDADDGSEPYRIERLLEKFKEDDHLGMCGSQFMNMTAEGNLYKVPAYRASEHDKIVEGMRNASQFCGATVMIRREVLDDIGPYQLYFNRLGGDDYDWTYRIVEKYKSMNLPDAFYIYRIHDSAVKVGNIDVRKFYVDKIIQFLHEQRIKNKGRDALTDKSLMPELEKKIEIWGRPFKEDPSYILRIRSRENINARQYIKSLKTGFEAINTKPLIMKNYTNLIYCIYVIFRRLIKI